MKKIQSMFQSLGEGMCLACAYIASLLDYKNEYEDNLNIAASVLSLAYSGIIGEDGYVKDAEKLFRFLTGKDYKISKKDIESLTELKGVKAAVRFDWNGNSHWVYADNGIIRYDSLDNSKCRKYGKPVTARVIEEIK